MSCCCYDPNGGGGGSSITTVNAINGLTATNPTGPIVTIDGSALQSLANTAIADSAAALSIASTALQTTSNQGAGEGLALPISGNNAPFKTLTAGAGVTLTPTANELQISASGGSTPSLQSVYDQSGTIATNGSGGPFDVTGAENITLFTSSDIQLGGTGSFIMNLPNGNGIAGQVIGSNGSGGVEWVAGSANPSQGNAGQLNAADGAGAWVGINLNYIENIFTNSLAFGPPAGPVPNQVINFSVGGNFASSLSLLTVNNAGQTAQRVSFSGDLSNEIGTVFLAGNGPGIDLKDVSTLRGQDGDNAASVPGSDVVITGGNGSPGPNPTNDGGSLSLFGGAPSGPGVNGNFIAGHSPQKVGVRFDDRADIDAAPNGYVLTRVSSGFAEWQPAAGGGVTDLQSAYDGGNIITTTPAGGQFGINGTEQINLQAGTGQNAFAVIANEPGNVAISIGAANAGTGNAETFVAADDNVFVTAIGGTLRLGGQALTVDRAGNTGSSGQVLGSDGSGGVDWVTPAGGASGGREVFDVALATQQNIPWNGAGGSFGNLYLSAVASGSGTAPLVEVNILCTQTGSIAGGISAGIYDINGQLLCASNITSAVAGLNTLPLTVGAGTVLASSTGYYLAVFSNEQGARIVGATGLTGVPGVSLGVLVPNATSLPGAGATGCPTNVSAFLGNQTTERFWCGFAS